MLAQRRDDSTDVGPTLAQSTLLSALESFFLAMSKDNIYCQFIDLKLCMLHDEVFWIDRLS